MGAPVATIRVGIVQFCVAAGYFAAAHAGFAFAFTTEQVSAIWPPTGLAVAAVILGGYRLCPGVAAGAFLANITSHEPVLTALGITVGNTLEAVACAWLMLRLPGFRPTLDRTRDVLALSGAAVLGTMVSATVGVASLRTSDIIGTGALADTWRVWWLGDVGGALLVAPVLMVFGARLRTAEVRDGVRLVVTSVGAAIPLALVGALVFLRDEPAAYLLLPCLFGIALRLRQAGATAGSLALACVAVWATRNGHGEFAVGTPDTQLLRAQMFCGVIGMTAMLVAAIRTERSDAEEQVALVEREVAQRTRELSAANSELEAFGYSVSHDLRAPLRAIDGYSKAVIEDFADVLDPEGLTMLYRVRGASQRMSQLIDEMLQLSRLARQPMHRARVDLSAIARTVVTDLRAAHPDSSAEVDIDDGLIVEGDRELLHTAVQNLLENAWKFSTDRDQPHIEFCRSAPDADVFVVRDNGVGFDTRYTDKLFRPFERLHTQAEFPGNGVGLSTVQRVVRRHGGAVWAKSELGAGAEFFFTLYGTEVGSCSTK